MNIREILGLAPVVPVLAIADPAHAVPLARALVAGGCRVMEVTLRTPAAVGGIDAIRKGVPEAIVGAGDLTKAVDFATAGRAGAQFGVSPGLTAELAAAARGARFPLLPGVMTPTEVISARSSGFDVLRLSPTQQPGCAAGLRALGASFPDVLFCPVGSNQSDASEYLALSNVISVAGSWIAPPALIEAGDWEGVTARAREAAGLKKR
jgi:2-dehydro-3-deoxyphosphogluconate aldolase / (4S)-4-hydroxy-2-oxoglutarate aldolase